jgi:ADP-ribose pyrophosphatase YjhB (NUDIX family)
MAWNPIEGESRVHPVCSSCGYIYFLNPKVVAGSLPIQAGRVILFRRGIEPAYGRWTFPAGYVDLGETVEDAAVREAREEIGLTIEPIRLLNLYSYHGAESVVAVYLAQVVDGEPRPGKEALECNSFDAQRIPWNDLAFRSTQDALRDWVQTGC